MRVSFAVFHHAAHILPGGHHDDQRSLLVPVHYFVTSIETPMGSVSVRLDHLCSRGRAALWGAAVSLSVPEAASCASLW